MNGASIPAVKVEHDDDGRVKSEPDSAMGSPSMMSDDDIYEDTGDLDFSPSQVVWLMRLPNWLWENWASIDDDERIELGTVRVEDLGEDANGESRQKMTMLLSSNLKSSKKLPKEYNMHITNTKSNNLYVFSEKDLPKSNKLKASQKSGHGAGDAGSSKVSHDGVRKSKWDKNKKWQPYYRKAIPKNTALAGIIKHEINCLPVENAEYARIMAERNAEAAKPKRETKFLGNVGANPSSVGMLGTNANFADFIRTGAPPRAKQQDHKAARIPQNELLDLIYECFKRYNYWSLKALKAELNQPEAYLKSTLEMIAELVKTGRFAMTWTLKPENKIEQYAGLEGKDELAPAPEPGFGYDGADDALESGIGDDEDDEDDDIVRMEDVMPS